MTDKAAVKEAIRGLVSASMTVTDRADREALIWAVQLVERASNRGGRDEKILEAIRRTDTIFDGGSWEETK